eukprot:1838173-Alexandrium_andersonii.AAC.1
MPKPAESRFRRSKAALGVHPFFVGPLRATESCCSGAVPLECRRVTTWRTAKTELRSQFDRWSRLSKWAPGSAERRRGAP